MPGRSSANAQLGRFYPCVALKLKNFNAMMGGRRSTSAADDDSESADERRSSKKRKASGNRNDDTGEKKPKWDGCFLCKDKDHRIADCPQKKLAAPADSLLSLKKESS